MNVGELKMLLEDMDDDMEVRLAMQPNYPMEYTIGDVVEVNLNDKTTEIQELREELENTEDAEEKSQLESDIMDLEQDQDDKEYIVYLSESSQTGYLPGIVSRELGWR